jgi:hypothetical protein
LVILVAYSQDRVAWLLIYPSITNHAQELSLKEREFKMQEGDILDLGVNK